MVDLNAESLPNEFMSDSYGGNGGGPFEYKVIDNHKITRIDIWTGKEYVIAIRLYSESEDIQNQ
jgi:hypothetical protein